MTSGSRKLLICGLGHIAHAAEALAELLRGSEPPLRKFSTSGIADIHL